MSTGARKKKLTTFQIANMLGMSDQSVSNWIDSGQLRAERTPGGHRRVEREDMIAFLREKRMRIPSEISPAPPTILIVDDEPGVAQWLSTVLSEEYPRCRILAAHDGFAAGKLVAADHPDLVILNLSMPGIDGFEVCRLIKEDPETRDITVVAVTAHPSAESEKAVRDAGAAACLSKPVEAGCLGGLVCDLLSRR